MFLLHGHCALQHQTGYKTQLLQTLFYELSDSVPQANSDYKTKRFFVDRSTVLNCYENQLNAKFNWPDLMKTEVTKDKHINERVDRDPFRKNIKNSGYSSE